MSKIAEIEGKLKTINGDVFHRLCDHLLKYKFNPNSINSTGSVIGKDKSKQGAPDCFFYGEKGNLIFSEYTTLEKIGKGQSFFTKLQNDIKHCFNESITKIANKDIKNVVLCHTSKLEVCEVEELQKLCKNYNRNCTLNEYGINYIAQSILDYPQLGEYIGVKGSTKQIQIPSDFVESYEKNKLSTPLSNEFIGRKNEIEKGLDLLQNNNLILVYGDAGTGKTKYCLELCRQFALCFDSAEIRCINNKGLELWDDLQNELIKDKNYILLVDDANRMSKNFEWTLNLLESNEKIKIISTVRSYALSRIEEISAKYKYEKILIEKFSDDDIKEILKSKDFKITDPNVIDRIIQLSKGNARIAIMSARYFQQMGNNIFSLNDASTVYEEYFSPIFKDIEILSDKKALSVLALISFFGKIDVDNRKLCDELFPQLNFSEEEFWTYCKVLNEEELVDMFENQIVKISDQILSTYLYYKAVIDKEGLPFSFFLNNYLSTHKYRFKDVVFSVVNTFNYKEIESKIRTQILAKWTEIKQSNNFNNQIEFFDLFFIYLPREILNFANDYIDSLPIIENPIYRYTVKHNEFSSGTESLIKILSNFQYIDRNCFKDAFQLLVKYAIKAPQKMPSLIYTIKEDFNFKKDGYTYGDDIQISIFDFLIKKAEEEEQENAYDNILSEILPEFFRIEHRQYVGNGHTFTIYTFHLWLRESIKIFRQNCFEYLDKLAIRSKSNFISFFSNLNVYDYKESDDIWKFDKEFIFKLINNHFDSYTFEDCYILNNLLYNFKNVKLDYPKNLKSKLKDGLFILSQSLKITEREEEEDFTKARNQYADRLKKRFENYNYNEYLKLLDDIDLILKKIEKDRDQYQYNNALNIILSNLAEKKSDDFIKVLHKCTLSYNFDIKYYQQFYVFFKFHPQDYYKLFEIIKGCDIYTLINYYSSFNAEFVSLEHLKEIYSNIIITFHSIKHINCLDISFLKKFIHLKPISEICDDILEILLNHSKENDAKISLSPDSFEWLLSIENIDYIKFKEVYFYAIKADKHADYEKKILKKLVQLHPEIITELLKFNQPEFSYSINDLSHNNFDFIWELDNCFNLIDSIIDYFIESKNWRIGETISAIFPNEDTEKGEKALKYIDKVITERFNNEEYIEIIFSLIVYKYPLIQLQKLQLLLTKNTNFELFKSLEITRTSRSWSGSEIPLIENDINRWRSVLSMLDEMPNTLDFLKHKEYAEKNIYWGQEEKKRVMKREFYEDY